MFSGGLFHKDDLFLRAGVVKENETDEDSKAAPCYMQLLDDLKSTACGLRAPFFGSESVPVRGPVPLPGHTTLSIFAHSNGAAVSHVCMYVPYYSTALQGPASKIFSQLEMNTAGTNNNKLGSPRINVN